MMTPNPTPRQRQALEALRNNTDVVDYLTACLEERKSKMLYLRDATDLTLCQGQAQFCQQLLDTVLGTTQQRSGQRR